MSVLPPYSPPDFNRPDLAASPPVRTAPAPADGVLPDGFHATSNLPEYVHLGNGEWLLAREGRMDGALILRGDELEVVEPRRVRRDDPVVMGRSDNGEEGIYVHDAGFGEDGTTGDKFGFRGIGSRETPYSRSYDHLYDILRHDRDHGSIIWVLGPAVAFDRDSREAMTRLIDGGYCHALLAGNALAVHDLEAALFHTGLGQDIYSQTLRPGGHHNHLDTINLFRRYRSIGDGIRAMGLTNGIMASCQRRGIPTVLAGSIRDDGPLPDVITDTCRAQDAMRLYARRATTAIGLATQLHTIALGNMLPGYRVTADGTVRPVFFYCVDMNEFSTVKLNNRGSLQAVPILTNVQDFLVNLSRSLTVPADHGGAGP